MNLKARAISLLLFSIVGHSFASQTPLLSYFDLYMQNYNPAYAGLLSKRFSFIGGYGLSSPTPPVNFGFRKLSNNSDQEGFQPAFHSNYVNFNFSTDIKLDNVPTFGIGFSYINNDLEYLETRNTAAISFSYIAQVKGGRLQFGLNGKRNMEFIASKRVYTVYNDYSYTINKLDQNKGNIDIGVMYANDSNTFNAGLALNNVFKESYMQNTLDNTFQLYSNRKPQLIGNITSVAHLSEKVKFTNEALVATNSNLSKPDYILKSTISGARLGAGWLIQRQYRHFVSGPTVRYFSSHVNVFFSLKVGYFNYSLYSLSEVGIVVK